MLITTLCSPMLTNVVHAETVKSTELVGETMVADKMLQERAVNWWQVGWVILTDWVEKLIDVDGKSEHNSTWTYMVSPSVEFNTGNMKNELYFQPQVDSRVGTMRMHGHRIIVVDIFAKMNLILSDASGKTVKSAVTTTNQYMYHNRANTDKLGKWKAQFVNSDTYKWQCYYAQYYDRVSREALPEAENGYYYGDDNRVYQYSDNESPVEITSYVDKVLNMSELNEQFINPADGITVDYLKDYAPGDIVKFSDTIVKIEYNSEENATSFFFKEEVSDKLIEWKFDGDLTSNYVVGDTLSLNFDVVKVGEYENIVFESLDYFEEAYKHQNGMAYPNINNYN